MKVYNFLFIMCSLTGVSFMHSADSINLLKAVLFHDSAKVKSLLNQGHDPNYVYLEKPIVHQALKQGDLEIATLLIKAGAIFSGFFEDGQDAFSYVASRFDTPTAGKNERPDFDLLQAMVKHGYDINENFTNKNLNNNAWYQVLKANKVFHIVYFLGLDDQFVNNPYRLLGIANANHVFIHSDGTTTSPLLIALENLTKPIKWPSIGLGTVGSLLKYGKANPNQIVYPKKGTAQSPLSYALENNLRSNGVSTINQLIEGGASLSQAIGLLIKNGGSPNYLIIDSFYKKNTSLLGLAIHYNDIDAVKILLLNKVDVNKHTDPFPYYADKSIEGMLNKPLYLALRQNRNEIAELLLLNGASV